MRLLIVCLTVFTVSYSLADAVPCTFAFDEENSVVEGTGYKYTEKTGVTGTFPGVKLNKSGKATTVKALLKDLEVTVDLVTLETGNALRDTNMRETLFSGILGDSVAVVKVKKVTDKKIETEMMLNEKSQKISFDYKIEGDILHATGAFDALKFALGEQIAALKKRCGSLHTGADGKSVTWTDFALAVKAKIKKTCK